jgi:hypothetical protein
MSPWNGAKVVVGDVVVMVVVRSRWWCGGGGGVEGVGPPPDSKSWHHSWQGRKDKVLEKQMIFVAFIIHGFIDSFIGLPFGAHWED